MKKLNLLFAITMLFVVNSFAQLNFGNGTSIVLDLGNSYRIYIKYDNKEVYRVINDKLQNMLLDEGIIDMITTGENGFKVEQNTDGEEAYSFLLDKETLDLYINKDLLDHKTFNRLQKGCKEIYDLLKEEKSKTKKEDCSSEKTKKKTKQSHFSYATNIDIDNNDTSYKVKAKYSETGQYEKLIAFLTKELGKENLKINDNDYQWSKKNNENYVYFFKVSKGKFKVVLDKVEMDNDLFEKLKKTARRANLMIKN